MTTDDALYSFAMRGLLAEESLDRAGRRALRLSGMPDEELAKKLALDQLDDQFVRRAQRMATVYTAIAAFESGVRELVEKVLVDAHGASWWQDSVSEKLRRKAERRKNEEEKFKWHGNRSVDPLGYTDLGDLANIIRAQWDHFEPFAKSSEWVSSIFDVIERSRNVIMHSGELADRDIERLGINIRDWIAQVGT